MKFINKMDLRIFQLLIDFGLVVLIFLVQLCIYPAFKYFESKNLHTWHKVYTPNITYVVFPLMLSQLILAVYFVYASFMLVDYLYLAIVGLTWLSTFTFYVPLHQKINSAKFTKKDLLKLEKGNWFRVFLWASILAISLTRFLIY